MATELACWDACKDEPKGPGLPATTLREADANSGNTDQLSLSKQHSDDMNGQGCLRFSAVEEPLSFRG